MGDALFCAGVVAALVGRTLQPSTLGWVFIAMAGLLSLYAAVSNVALQLSRLRDPQAGWRFRVLGETEAGLNLKTPGSQLQIGWRHVEAVKELDARHLLLVLPSPLPLELRAAGLPLEDLRESAEALVPELAPPPEKFGFVLHEQELGRPICEAARSMSQRIVAPRDR